jgi:flagellar assembly protein FliH
MSKGDAKNKLRVYEASTVVDCQKWELPEVDLHIKQGQQSKEKNNVSPLTLSKIEELQQQAYDEAYQKGLQKGEQDGHTSAMNAVKEKLDTLNGILNLLNNPLAEMDKEVEDQLVSLSTVIAKHLIRRELKTDPGQIVAVVKESISNLPVASRNVRVYLHPEDAELLKETLRLHEGESTWTIEEDPMLSRGGCKIISENSQIDATVETRLAAIIAKVLGGERENDTSGE